MDEATRLRVRAALSSWFTALLIVSVVVGTAGVWATYTAHVDPGTTTAERTVTEWSATGSFDHSATVSESNPLYPVGAELTNRSTYFSAATPVLDGVYSVETSGLGGDASVELATTLEIRSADDETTYWRDTRPLNETTARTGDGPTAVSFSINTTAVENRVAAIQNSIGSAPGETSVAVVVDARIAGATGDGADSRLRFSSRLPIALGGDTYTVSDPGTDNEAVDRTVTERVPREYGPVRSVGGPLALALGLLAMGALGVVVGRGRPAIMEAERARLEFLEDRSEFDQWIVSVRLPPDATDRPTAEAASLADLVNLAIDSDAAVIEDPDDGAFHVVTGQYRYVYRPPSAIEGDLGIGDGLPFGTDPSSSGEPSDVGDAGELVDAGEEAVVPEGSDASEDTGVAAGASVDAPDIATNGSESDHPDEASSGDDDRR